MPPKTPDKPKKPKHEPETELRRAYEHLGRIESLLPIALKAGAKPAQSLLAFAHAALQAGHGKDAAEMLRAAEHLCFAVLAPVEIPEMSVSPPLLSAVDEQYEHLLRKAEERWAERDATGPREADLAEIYRHMREHAGILYEQKRYLGALELARGAEALAHVEPHKARKLPGVRPVLQLEQP